MSDDPLPAVLIANRQDRPVAESDLAELARACLAGEGAMNAELSVSFVGADEIAELHERYLGEPGPTDVLSFPQEDEVAAAEGRGTRLLGDVVICPEIAARNNPDDPGAEIRLLLVHGILHLLGHDHEDEDERAQMWAIQERYSGVRIP